jgi:hypothetical protein
MSNDLTLLFPAGQQLSIRDENITIKPFKFGDLPKVFKCLEPLTTSMAKMVADRNTSPAAIAMLMAEGGDSVLDLMVIGSKQNKVWIEELEMDEGVELLTAIFEVNADFFIQKVLPKVNKTVAATGQMS